MIVTALTEIPPDSGSAGYVVAAVIVSAILVLTYLVIVAFRVRDAARRLEALESRLDGAAARVGGTGTADPAPGGAVGDPAAVAAAAESRGARR
ncbi:unannotated protein [freshwater metagenome]|uniref:Unannotated protein n=1 Tax=freshwater metagenome TaxID=449393 RepID=A0A6J7HA98_9ZZZZ|nr:hypothetical protein [Actinomycetota bacterium]